MGFTLRSGVGTVLAVMFASGWLVPCASGQERKAAVNAPVFDVVSFKYSGTPADHETMHGNDRTSSYQPAEYKGERFACDAPLSTIIRYAFGPLVTPYRDKVPDWFHLNYYKIDAIAPKGSTLDSVRAMLRAALVERLGLQYQIVDDKTPVYFLVRGGGPLKLLPSVTAPAAVPQHSPWEFQNEAASIDMLARFFSSAAGREVIDRTGIQGNYAFHISWEHEAQEGEMSMNGPGLAIVKAKELGLKLEPGTEMRKLLVVDRANKLPTGN